MTSGSKDMVTTPGGPRPAELVHTVPPGGTVQRTVRGDFAVVPKPRLDAAETKRLLDTGLYTITPGGIRPKSLVHTLGPQEIVRRHEGVFKRFNLQRQTFIEAPPLAVESLHLPAFGSGWIVFGSYTEDAANVIASMTTTWTVPPAPANQDSQLIYLFNGLQDAGPTHILQPVLQWGTSPDGGGNSWAVASWFVDSSGNAFKTSLVQVNEGDSLTGVMQLTGQSGGTFNYTCAFSGLGTTLLTVNGANQLINPVETLECYGISACADYPNTLLTSMRAIGVSTATGSLALNFGAVDKVTDCGQNAVVVSNAASAGQVDLYYHSQFSGPAPSPVASINRTTDTLDLFVVGFDGGVYSTFWNANGWNEPWFRIADTNFGDLFTIAPHSEVAVLSRFPQHLDLFVAGRDSAIYSTFWDANGGWFNHWFRLADSNFPDGFKIPAGSSVSSLSRYSDHIDLFVSGFDGGIYSTFWDVTSGWFGHWFRLGDTNFGDDFTIPPGAPISNLSRYKDHIDLFVSGRDGGIYSTFWDVNSGWFGHWFRLGDTNFGDDFTIPPGAPISNLSRYQDHIDLFVSGRDGGVYSTFWDANGGWFNRWFRLADTNFGDGFTIPPGAPVSSLTRYRDHIDLFVAGHDGGVYSTFWDANGGWFNHWFRLTDSNFGDGFTVPPGSRIYSLSRFRDHIDLFVMGRDGAVYSTFWDANGGWFGHWFRV